MNAIGCPYVSGPACNDCNGSCWAPLYEEPEPERVPCEGCYYVTGHMQDCDGTCDGLTAENIEQRRADYAKESR